ncbi:hypothetical protein EDB92DRAFT_1762266, partial [Lactarius akahatsu]
KFLHPVSEQCRRDCISKFIDATGNDATATSICAVCAGHFFSTEIGAVKVSDLEQKNKLMLTKPHPAHVLTNGMLLHTSDDCLHRARSWATTGLQSGLRGNVSSYRLNTQDVVHMTDGQLMPPSSSILAATIGVTFVGPKNLPQKTLPGFLRVNRTCVRDALLWLKRNNPVYEDIIISSDRLNELPIDGIPDEISSLAKHSNDTSLLAEETDGYVPEPCANDDDAQNIPLHSLGVVDVAASDVNENEMLAHALLNVARSEIEDGWAIKHGSDFVNEYPRKTADGKLSDGYGNNPNHLLGSFPCLFPYGKGGFEVKRPFPVTYSNHARWAIRYADKRFRKDLYFIFEVFGVLQKCQVCRATALQITRSSFLQHEREIRQLTPFDFETAAAEEQAHKPFSNPVMRNLRQNLSTVRAKTMATDKSRINIRSLIWGMCIKKNPPSVWLTINPADTQDPVAHVLCGENIDLDAFDAHDERPSAVAIAADPFASASFFHLTINALLQTLLGIEGYTHNQSIHHEIGILREVSAFIGTIEAQGRGTLHLHMILWLCGSPPLQEMKERL